MLVKQDLRVELRTPRMQQHSEFVQCVVVHASVHVPAAAVAVEARRHRSAATAGLPLCAWLLFVCWLVVVAPCLCGILHIMHS